MDTKRLVLLVKKSRWSVASRMALNAPSLDHFRTRLVKTHVVEMEDKVLVAVTMGLFRGFWRPLILHTCGRVT